MRNQSIKTVLVSSLIGMFFYASGTYADNEWGTSSGAYHWARTSNPFELMVIDSVTSDWQFELETALAEWNLSGALNMSMPDASANDSNKTRKQCKMQLGQMRVCNAGYGFNGWLGRASISIDSNGHIVQGKAQVNDSYSSYWADPNEKRHVMCQEIGHVFGLGHTSTNGSSQLTCMDYSSDPNSISPNQHDYITLTAIYSHMDSYNSFDQGGEPPPDEGGEDGGCNAPPGRGCNKAGVGPGSDGPPPMGVRVYGDEHQEIWVASRAGGGLWIHHVRLVPDEFRIVR